MLGIADRILGIVGKFIPDKDQRDRLEHDLRQGEQNGTLALALGQIEINKIDAASRNPFQSGWRPAVGWVSVAALANNFLFRPYAVAFGLDVPELDLYELMGLLTGLLGLGAYRTYEKGKGAAK